MVDVGTDPSSERIQKQPSVPVSLVQPGSLYLFTAVDLRVDVAPRAKIIKMCHYELIWTVVTESHLEVKAGWRKRKPSHQLSSNMAAPLRGGHHKLGCWDIHVLYKHTLSL